MADLDLFKGEWTFTRGFTVELLDSLTGSEWIMLRALNLAFLEAISSRGPSTGVLSGWKAWGV